MEKIVVKELYHRGERNIAIYCRAEPDFIFILKKGLNARWTQTHKCWYIVYSPEGLAKVIGSFAGKALIQNYFIEGVDTEEEIKIEKPIPAIAISKINGEHFKNFIRELELRGYSKSTIRTYKNELIPYFTILREVDAACMHVERIKDYLHYCIDTLKLSEATMHSRINSLKFFYEKVLKMDNFFFSVPRPKKPLQMPKVISKEKIAQLINSIENTKHKTIIMLTYACGLRVSEVVSLKVSDVDENRRLLLVRQSKGKKDRVISLSGGMLLMLSNYCRIYKPQDYLFESSNKKSHLSARSIQSVLQKAKDSVGIKVSGNMHVLRHSFATHLLDKGIDVVFIQRLLGHNDLKTTLKYLHVTNKDLINIISPLDDIENLLRK